MVIDLDVPRDTVLARISARRVCRDCGTNYTATGLERQPWICEVCGGDVMQRDDDTPDAVNRRLDLYETQTAPLIEFYEGQGRLVVIDGVGHPDDVFRRLTDSVDDAKALTRRVSGRDLYLGWDRPGIRDDPRPETIPARHAACRPPASRALRDRDARRRSAEAHLARSPALVLDPSAASIDPRSVRRPVVSFVRAQPPG